MKKKYYSKLKGWFKRWRIPKNERCHECDGMGGWWYDCGRYEFPKDDRLRWQACPGCSAHGRVLQLPAGSVGVYR